MKIPPYFKNLAAALLLALGATADPVSGSEVGKTEGGTSSESPKALARVSEDCLGLVGASSPAPRSTASTPQAPQQQVAGNDQQTTIPIYSPGTDQANYVPGSTARPFGQIDSFNLGKILFRPSARISYLYESNLLNTPRSSAVGAHSFHLMPSVEVFIPVTRNGVRIAYSPTYRRYSDYDLSRNVSHVLDADSQFDLTPLLSIALREHFALSSLDSREFVPGRELIFSDAPFKRNDVGAQLNWTISDTDTLGLKSDWNRVVFDEVRPGISLDGDGGYVQTPFYDYDRYQYGGFYRRSLSQRTGLIASGAYFRHLAKDPRNIASSRGFEALIGIETALTPLISGQFSAGYRGETFPGAPGQRYRGAIYRGLLQKEFTETIRVGLAVSRDTNPSFFQNNAYYTTSGVGITYTHELGPRLSLSVNPGYQKNSYPVPLEAGSSIPSSLAGTENRSDRLLEVSVDARYRFTNWIALEFLYDIIHRDSVLPEYRFTSYAVGGGLLIGLPGTNRGRMPY